ncbi:MAG: hypothetical protein Q4C06_01130 [Bacillota bacterium]|nr:hypothetical protein [Bacillota bacterium]
MKKWKKMMAILVTMVMAVSMAACGGGGGGEAPEEKALTSGHYLLYSLYDEADDITLDREFLIMAELAESYLTLHGDGTGDLYLEGQAVEKMTVDEENGFLTYDDDSAMPMEINGEEVIVTMDDGVSCMIWTFVKEEGETAGGDAGGTAAASGEMAVLDYSEDGEVFFEYPSDTFAFEHKYGLDYLNAADGSVSISFVADWDMEEYAATMEGYQVYVNENGGIYEEGLSYGGYEAVRVTYESVFSVDQYTYIFFGEGAGKYVGISACASADEQAGLDANAAQIDAILNSVSLG